MIELVSGYDFDLLLGLGRYLCRILDCLGNAPTRILLCFDRHCFAMSLEVSTGRGMLLLSLSFVFVLTLKIHRRGSPRHKDLCSSTDFEALMNEMVGCRTLAELYLSISTMPLEVSTVLSLPALSVITLNLRGMAFFLDDSRLRNWCSCSITLPRHCRTRKK